MVVEGWGKGVRRFGCSWQSGKFCKNRTWLKGCHEAREILLVSSDFVRFAPIRGIYFSLKTSDR